jgi:hypothetical protein
MLFLLILTLFVTLGSCVDLNLIAPVAGNTWATGQKVTVLWDVGSLKTSDGHSLTQIDIDLVQDSPDNVVSNISFGVPIELKSADWVVSKKLPAGEYMVRITSVEDPKFRLVGPKFLITRNGTKAASNPATIKAEPMVAGLPFYIYFALMGFFFLL